MPVTVEYPIFESKALADNPLGDSAIRTVPVVLPPDYGVSGRRYPVIVGLTWFTGRGAMLLNVGSWGPNLSERLERLYTAGMPHAFFVLPDCFTAYGGSQYLNSSATGRYEDYVIDELIPWVDARYRTIAAPEGRGVFGTSSGGYGSMILGMRHPETFGALACHSGDMAFELCYAGDFPAFCKAVNKAGGVESWWRGAREKLRTVEKVGHEEMGVLNILAMAACYSPDPDQPLGIALPMALDTCERIAPVWSRWLGWDPVELLDRYGENLRRLRLLYIDCGNRDEFNLQFGARQMSKRLKERSVAHDYEEFDDGHMNIQYRYDVSLPKLARALAH